jgi:antitoxin (DNA-binding transcriptional repressor) of toxin-antitoxin stability system
MFTVDISKAKTHLSKLVAMAAKGEAFVIAKGGEPLVKVSSLEAPDEPRRLGFLVGEIAVPRDFDRMGDAEIDPLFGNGN